LLLQLTVIIVTARLFAWLFRRMGQPGVVGEIAAGLVLGPSVLGRLLPGVFEALFHPAVPGLSPEVGDVLMNKVITTLCQLGLIFLLFLVGLEFDFAHLRRQGRTALVVSLAGIALPFGLGVLLGYLIHPMVAAEIDVKGFTLFMGTSMAITAMPVLGRMMMEMGITRTRLAVLAITAAAINDATGWILLASVAAGVRAAFSPLATLGMAAATLAFAAFLVFALRPVLRKTVRELLRRGDGELGVNGLAGLFAVLFLCAVATNVIGIFAVFGAFLLGAVLSDEFEFRGAVNRRMRDFVTGFFLPIIFAYTGLRTDIAVLETWQLWIVAGTVCAAAIVGKLGGCAAAARLNGLSLRESACLGAMMNTRGLMELIVINVGRDLGVIPDSVYCMLVLMAVLTTAMTAPLLLWLMPGTELEGPIRRSGLLGKPLSGAEEGEMIEA
jgi:Kef-type K+ transport system membrane component KefB